MRKVLSSYILTIISLSLVLFLLGLYLVITSQSGQILDSLKERINIVIELVEDYDDLAKTDIINSLKSNEAVLSSSIQFLTKEDAKLMMVGDDELIFMDDSLQNPFRDAIVVNLDSDNYELNFLEKFSSVLESQNIVSEVYYQEDLFQLVNSNLNKLSLILLIVGALMLLLAISLIYNTVNLSLMSDKQKIQTMELVGAERNYIRKPYLWRSLLIGFVSFILGAMLLLVFVFLIAFNFQFIQDSLNYLFLALVIFLLLILGVGIPIFSTNKIVNRHLNKI